MVVDMGVFQINSLTTSKRSKGKVEDQYYPNFGFFDRFKFNCVKCKSSQRGFRRAYNHLLHHNQGFYDAYQILDTNISDRAEFVNIEVDDTYQKHLCSKFENQIFNFSIWSEKMKKLI